MSRVVAAIVLTLALAAVASADDQVTGFVASGSGALTGRVTDADNKPIHDLEVHVVSRTGGEQIVKTNRDGTFELQLRGVAREPSIVFVGRSDVHISGQTAATSEHGDEEVIAIRETLPPAVAARPVSTAVTIPDYTDAAIDRDVWTRAWLLLDIDDTGAVRRLKFLKRAGYGLDTIALREGFRLHFEPARDRAARPMESLMLYSFEWPSHAWLVGHGESAYRMPADVIEMPCQKPGETHADYRDCSKPDPRLSLYESWIVPRPH
jgi:hypothetical protein